MNMSAAKDPETVKKNVREGYAAIAQGHGCCSGGCCCQNTVSADALARSVGYDEESLKDLPEGANMGLSCGNPLTIASLKEGQTVVDLGSGGGFDVFQAGRRVGKSGRAIGVDMTWEMLEKARHNIAVYRDTTGLDNVEFRLGEIEHLPVADASVDVVISNCVINLSPDKPQVWREVYRVLKKGGRAAVSDLHLLKPLPESIAGKVEAWVGCVAGAVLVDDTRSMLNEAGFSSVKLTPRTEYIRSMQSMEDPLYREIAEALPAGSDVSD